MKALIIIAALIVLAVALYLGAHIFTFVGAAPVFEGLIALFVWALLSFTGGALMAEGLSL